MLADLVGKWHKPEGVKFELPYNKKIVLEKMLAN